MLIGPPSDEKITNTDEAIDALLVHHLGKLSIKDAASVVAEETGMPRRIVYARAVALARNSDADQ